MDVRIYRGKPRVYYIFVRDTSSVIHGRLQAPKLSRDIVSAVPADSSQQLYITQGPKLTPNT